MNHPKKIDELFCLTFFVIHFPYLYSFFFLLNHHNIHHIFIQEELKINIKTTRSTGGLIGPKGLLLVVALLRVL